MVMNSHLISHIHVEIVYLFLILFLVSIYVGNTCTYIYIIEVLEVIKMLFKVLEVFVI